MSDGIKAWHDEMDEWADFCKLTNLNAYSWNSYSNEAKYAKAGYKAYSLRGPNLVEYVVLMLQVDKIVKRQKDEDADYEQYLKLKEKFESK